MGFAITKFIDRYIGAIIVLLLAPFSRSPKLFSYSNIAVIQFWGVGETLLTFPAIAALRKRYSKANITIIATSRVKDVYSGMKFMDSMDLISASPWGIVRYCLSHLRHYDLVVDFEEYLTASAIMSFFIGRERLGYSNLLRRLLYTKKVLYNDQQHVVETHLDLVRLVAADAKPKSLIAPYVSKEDDRKAALLLKDAGANGFIVGIAPGVAESAKSRMWPLQRYGELARQLASEMNAKVIFFGGPEEASTITTIIQDSGVEALNFAGKTNLKQLFALIGKCSLFIGNDSGPMHIAAAMGVPTVGLFGPNLPARWAPFGSRNTSIYKGTVCRFSPCINVHKGIVPECYLHNNICMQEISVDDVMEAARKVKA